MADTSKIPIRGVTKLLNALDPSIRSKLENAFIEAEEQLNVHNTSTIDKLSRRLPNGRVNAPILSVTTNNLGFDLNWPKLKDRVITMYEVQIATAHNFHNAISYNTVDNFFAVEGASTITYARVRGLRWNGDTSPWSNIQTINVVPIPAGPIVYSRTIANIASFYIAYPGLIYPSPIQEMTITPQRQNGGVMFFGSVGVEFYVDTTGFRGKRGDHYYIGADTTIDDSMFVTINGKLMETLQYIPCFQAPGWSNLVSPPQSTVFGYSVGFGPGYLPHSQFYFAQHGGQAPDIVQHLNDNIQGAGATIFPGSWTTKRALQDEVNTSASTNTANDSSVYRITYVGSPFVNAPTIPSTDYTKTLKANNYRFTVPSTEIITGIQLNLYTQVGVGVDTQQINRIRLYDQTGVARPTIKGSGDTWPITPGGYGLLPTMYGGSSDLWGEVAGFWTPTKINSPNFGIDLQGKITYTNVFTSADNGLVVEGMELVVYTNLNGEEKAYIQLRYRPRTNDFYSYPYTRSVLKNCTINALEFGTGIT